MKKYILLIIFLSPLFCFAQLFKGIVVDSNAHPIDAVTLTLSQKNKIVATERSKNGSFSFKNLINGNYILSASAVGYERMEQSIHLPMDSISIRLTVATNTLQQVNITSGKPLIERKIDRVIFNVENSILASGGTVWDALGKSPGVQTKFDGGITANNKGAVIYMDDKPLRISGENLTAYLQSLPSDNIARIEVISNPPAKYDAQGGAIINIITKKPKGDGLSATLSGGYTQASYSSYNSAAIFNLRNNKLNVYGTYGYSDRKKDHTETEYIIFETPQNYANWQNEKLGIRSGNANSYKLGADYNLTSKQIIGFLINGYNGRNQIKNNTKTSIFNNHKTLPDSTLETNNLSTGKTAQFSFNLNYKIKIDTAGQSLNLDIDYVPFRNNNNQHVISHSMLPNGNILSDSYNISTPASQHINIYSGKLDYTYPVSKNWKIESGLKYSSITTKNSLDFFNTSTQVPVLVQELSDKFNYQENTAAFYASANGEMGKWSFQGGLRGEYTNTRGTSLSLAKTNKNNYFRLFPSLFIIYKVSKDHELNLVYNSRINRPDYWRLNPFKSYTSPYTYLEGNPGLQPATIYNSELGYTYKQKYNLSVYLRRTLNYFSNISVQDNQSKIFYDTQANLDLSQEIGVSVSFPLNPTSWWEINNDIQAARRQERSGYLQASYDYRALGVYLSSSHAFTLSKNLGLKAEISAWYSSPTVQGIYKLARTYDVSAGIRKTILHGQGTFRLACGDLFYGNAFRIDVDYENQRNGFYEKSDTRNATFSFSYRLGNNVTASRKRSTASEEEKKRTQ
ncbi:TonB-dependent receptor domain-containing protein [Pedobacter nototheniae]|uniref:TonB-dependent receptor domain-containing protein n=1 Tax=Pedobacter nototheniae TaxID=2488994 RepID=UPI00292F95B5|nr:TonB-dependent receptor [Pedobacter nototheniae]